LTLTLGNLAVPKTVVMIKATMTSMDMLYPITDSLTAITGYDAVIVVYIHIGVGFGVARFDY